MTNNIDNMDEKARRRKRIQEKKAYKFIDPNEPKPYEDAFEKKNFSLGKPVEFGLFFSSVIFVYFLICIIINIIF